VRLKTLKLTE